jgi:antitoxin HicB
MSNPHIGSDFDDFLDEVGILAGVESVAIKRVIAFQVSDVMKEKNLSKAEMLRRMKTSCSSIDRLLDPDNRSTALQTMEGTALAMGAHLKI